MGNIQGRPCMSQSQSALLKPSSTASITMRAAVLQCLLEAALIQANIYAWRGQVVDSRTEKACLTDQGSCGCCLMQQQIQRMKMFFNTSLTELEQELTKTKNILNNIRISLRTFNPSEAIILHQHQHER
ncbi:hypothetical protein F7725_020916 [Dissostichus mawsoni]|uniref:Uncharacterized protein n=1 Tax=Dissostichus mawsoni TaxID=36200 RepID=A0A7J5YHY8_DISMA|nr:hypothetical protein F7725_020916 [Dissostichus mawsoni]